MPVNKCCTRKRLARQMDANRRQSVDEILNKYE